MPIELASFNATNHNNSSYLEWETLIEINNKGFEVLHSTNTIKWEVLEFVIGQNTDAYYNYIHSDPQAGKNYYRLKQIDFDGQFTLSDIRTVYVEDARLDLHFFPNPTTYFITINGGTGSSTAFLYDAKGWLVCQVNLAVTARIDLTAFDSGIYILSVKNQDNVITHTERVVKL